MTHNTNRARTRYFALILLTLPAILAANGQEPITETMSTLALQLGVIIFAVKALGAIARRIGVPAVLGELVAGIAIGPFALGAIPLPGICPEGLFPEQLSSLAVSPELYSFATIASIILLFASGLETDLGLFLKYSVAGGIIGIGGVIFSFVLGDGLGMYALKAEFMDPRCLFLGILSTATSVGITARILSDRKKIDSPEGVTILAAAVFDDILGIIILAVVLGIVAALSGSQGGGFDPALIAGIAGKAFGIWLGATALGLIFSKRIASFLKIFKHSYDFSICALGIALLLAGLFEKQGLAMIIGAYVAGLSISKTDIAAVVQERIHGLYEFFVPIFFAVMGMLVNLREFLSPEILALGLAYSGIAIVAKVVGCGLPALALGFNSRGALRIGAGMVPRGEVALIIAGIGIAAGILSEELFGVAIMMTLITTLVAPPVLNFALGLPGRGTRKETRSGNAQVITWDFHSDEIADLVVDILLKDLKAEGFYVQMMNIDDGLSQARKDDIALSITEEETRVSIAAAPEDIPFVKTSIFEVIVQLNASIESLKIFSNPEIFKKDSAPGGARVDRTLFKLIRPECIETHLKGETKEELLGELVDLLAKSGNVKNRDQIFEDVMTRERVMSTGMQRGICIPHAKTDGISAMTVVVGIKKKGVDFNSLDGIPSRLFIMVVSPKKSSGPHLQFLASIGNILKDKVLTERILRAHRPEEVAELLTSQ